MKSSRIGIFSLDNFCDMSGLISVYMYDDNRITPKVLTVKHNDTIIKCPYESVLILFNEVRYLTRCRSMFILDFSSLRNHAQTRSQNQPEYLTMRVENRRDLFLSTIDSCSWFRGGRRVHHSTILFKDKRTFVWSFIGCVLPASSWQYFFHYFRYGAIRKVGRRRVCRCGRRRICRKGQQRPGHGTDLEVYLFRHVLRKELVWDTGSRRISKCFIFHFTNSSYANVIITNAYDIQMYRVNRLKVNKK